MTCTTCGGRPIVDCADCGRKARPPRPPKCGNTPKVLEINNVNYTLFHRVDIDGTESDLWADGETHYSVPNGLYKNVLLRLNGNDHKWLYSSDGIGTRIGQDARSFNELDDRPKYAGEEMTGNTNIPDVTASVTAERRARVAADNILQANIDAETAARTAADAELSANLSAEETARTTADTALDGRLTTVESDIDTLQSDLATESSTRSTADDSLQAQISTNAGDIDDLQASDTTIRTALDTTVVSDFALDANPSTVTLTLAESKKNLLSGQTSSESTALPVASTTQAGVMNSATYDAVQQNSQNIANILGGSVAVSGINESYTQQELTTAFLTASGESSVPNGASIWDITNTRKFEYYSNISQWVIIQSGNSGQVTVSPFTNLVAGIILGSNVDGQVYAESNGTGSVVGWDALKARVTNAETGISDLETDMTAAETAITNLQNGVAITKISGSTDAWTLNDGIYAYSNGTINLSTTASFTVPSTSTAIVVVNTAGTNTMKTIYFDYNARPYVVTVTAATGVASTIDPFGYVLTTSQVKNNLTTATAGSGVLDAYQGKVLKDSIDGKVSTYTSGSTEWDTTPTANSTKPVTSGGIYNVIGNVETLLATL